MCPRFYWLTLLAIVGNLASAFSSTPTTLPSLITYQPTNTRQWVSSSGNVRPLATSAVSINGGAREELEDSMTKTTTSWRTALASLWGTGGVVYILVKAIRRVLPIALEPFQDGAVPLSQFELGAYMITCLWFAYVEGYKGFQLKFSPLVVKRSWTFQSGKNRFHHYLLAPMYSMGMVHATRKRKIVSWSVSLGVASIVAIVKRLPYPWRNIIDAGVVAGLSWGTLSILLMYVQTLIRGQPPDIDPALPETDDSKTD